MIYDSYFFPYMFYPRIPHMDTRPPTIYSLLESIVNYGTDNKQKIKDLAKYGRSTFFDFDYDLSTHISKEKFETTILNHFLMRRIGFDTLTAFRIQLNVKLNEIMPLYNKMFDELDNWDIFNDGETISKTGNVTDNTTKNSTTSNTSSNTSTNNTSNSLTNNSTNNTTVISDRRKSDTPQNQLSEIRDGNYVTEYNYDNNTTTSQDASTSNGSGTSSTNENGSSSTTENSTDNKLNNYQEIITRTPGDKVAIYKELQQNINNIFTLIFNDLECLFYQLV